MYSPWLALLIACCACADTKWDSVPTPLQLTWNGAPWQSASASGAVLSSRKQSGQSYIPVSFGLATDPLNQAGLPLTLVNTSAPGQGLPATLRFAKGATAQTVSDSQWTGIVFSGTQKAAEAVTLTMEVDGARLATLPAGSYAATYTLCLSSDGNYASGCSRRSDKNNDAASVDLQVDIPAAVRVNGLGDISLGTWSGSGDMSASSAAFCIGTNGSGVNLALSSLNGGAGAWLLRDGPNSLGYAVGLSGVGAAGSVASGSTYSLTKGSGTGVQGLDCATAGSVIHIAVPAPNNLETAVPGSYRDTITLSVQPI